MQHQIHGNPDYGHITVVLEPGDTFIAEAGAMSWMNEGMQIKSRLLGGMMKAMIRKLVGGKRIDSVDDVVKVGQKIQVELKEIDPRGKLSLAAVLPEAEPDAKAESDSAKAEEPADA